MATAGRSRTAGTAAGPPAATGPPAPPPGRVATVGRSRAAGTASGPGGNSGTLRRRRCRRRRRRRTRGSLLFDVPRRVAGPDGPDQCQRSPPHRVLVIRARRGYAWSSRIPGWTVSEPH